MNEAVDSKKAFAIVGVTAFIVFCILVPLAFLGSYVLRNLSTVRSQRQITAEPAASPLPTETERPTATQFAAPAASVTPTSTNANPYSAAQYFFDAAYSHTLAGNHAAALPFWDQALSEAPDNGDAYFYRAMCYLNVARGQNIKSEFDRQMAQALSDIDNAIAHGLTMEKPGDPYDLRFQIYEVMAGGVEIAAERLPLHQLALENLYAAAALGTTEAYPEQSIPIVFFESNRCEEGMNAIRAAREYYGLSAPPSASMLNIEAHGHLCLNRFDKALEFVDRSLAIEVVPERLWLRANILYLMGRRGDALRELNGLIDAQPAYKGYRYYLRALIHYENGQRDLAEADLAMGSRNTWGQGGLRAYLAGLLALEDGDRELGIQSLQYAVATMDWMHRSLVPKIERKLASLGAQPLPNEPQSSGFLQATPIPTFAPTPAVPVAVNSRGIPLPPNIVVVDMYAGTGPLRIDHVYPYRVFLFQASAPPPIRSVESLQIYLEPSPGLVRGGFEVFIWEFRTGEWTLFKPDWGTTAIEDPARFVDSNGDVHLTLRPDYNTTLHIGNISITITARGTDGSQITLGRQE